MSTNLITGYAGKSHITSAGDGAVNAAVLGNGRYVLDIAEKFAYELISNNQIRIKSGYAVDQGRKIELAVNDYEELTIDNGLQGVKRCDLIAITYEKNLETGIETATINIIKGTSGDDYTDPEYTAGDIIAGDIKDDFLLYRLKLNGISVEAVEPLFEVRKSVVKMDSSENTTAFSMASARENLESGEKHNILFGKIAKWFADLKTVAFSGNYNDLSNKPAIPAVVNNNTTTEAGYALDARQANPNVDGSLAKQISTLNSGLILRPIYPLYTGKTAVSGTRDVPYKVTKDGYIQFWYKVDDGKNNSNCGIVCYIDGTIVHEYFEYHQAGAANANYSALFPVLRGQTAQFHIITDSVTQSAMIYYYPNRA